jgi:hypothetical protein
MPQAVEPRDEPDWVKRLRARGIDVQGGNNPLPFEPDASFAPMRQRRMSTTVRAILRWFRRSHRITRLRRHAPVP